MEGEGVRCEVAGLGPEAVLFVHGLGSSRACWREAPRFFDLDRHRLVLPDLPAFGESPVPATGDLSMEGLAAALGDLLERQSIRRVHLVAHSMGGAVALLLAGRPGLEVASFASAEGNLVAEDAFMSGKVARLAERTFVRVFSKWLHMVEQSLGEEPSVAHETFLASLRGTDPVALHRVSVACVDLTSSGDLAERFAALRCPRMYLVGERSLAGRPLPDPVLAPAVEVVTVAGAGHFVMDRAEVFYPAVRRLIDGAEPTETKGPVP